MRSPVVLALALLCSCHDFSLSVPPPAPLPPPPEPEKHVTLDGFAPNTAFADDVLTLTGTHFDPDPAKNQVRFGTIIATPLAVTGPAEGVQTLTVAVPDDAPRKPFLLSVQSPIGAGLAKETFTYRGLGHLRNHRLAGTVPLQSDVKLVAEVNEVICAFLARYGSVSCDGRLLFTTEPPIDMARVGKLGLALLSMVPSSDTTLPPVYRFSTYADLIFGDLLPLASVTFGPNTLADVDVDGRPQLAVSPDGNRAFVATDGALFVIKLPLTPTSTVTRVPFNNLSAARGIACPRPDNLVLLFDGGLARINPAALPTEITVDVPHFPKHPAQGLAVTPDGCRAVILETSKTSILELVPLCTPPPKIPLAIAMPVAGVALTLDASGKRAFVNSKASDSVLTIDLEAEAVLGSASVGRDPGPPVLALDGRSVLVPLTGESEVAVLSPVTGTRLATRRFRPKASSLALSADGISLYLVINGQLGVINTATEKYATLPDGDEPLLIGVRPDSGALWAAGPKGLSLRALKGVAVKIPTVLPTLGATALLQFTPLVEALTVEKVTGMPARLHLYSGSAGDDALTESRLPTLEAKELLPWGAAGDGTLTHVVMVSSKDTDYTGKFTVATLRGQTALLHETPEFDHDTVFQGFPPPVVCAAHPTRGLAIFGSFVPGGLVDLSSNQAVLAPADALLKEGGESFVTLPRLVGGPRAFEVSLPTAIRFSADGRLIYGVFPRNDINLESHLGVMPLDLADSARATQVRLPEAQASDDGFVEEGLPGDLLATPDGERMFLLDRGNDQILIFN